MAGGGSAALKGSFKQAPGFSPDRIAGLESNGGAGANGSSADFNSFNIA